jgi:hypothetical protein
VQLTFVDKMGLKNHLDGKKFKPLRKNAKARHSSDKLSSTSSPVTREDVRVDDAGKRVKTL